VIDGAVQADVVGASHLLPHIVRVADENGFSVTDLSVSEPSLETVFITLTGKDLRD
jgi:ABC-2 type transport system ATP-binding protein